MMMVMLLSMIGTKTRLSFPDRPGQSWSIQAEGKPRTAPAPLCVHQFLKATAGSGSLSSSSSLCRRARLAKARWMAARNAAWRRR